MMSVPSSNQQGAVCDREHVIEQPNGDGLRFVVRCGDDVLGDHTFDPAESDQDDVQIWARCVMLGHERDALRAQLQTVLDLHQPIDEEAEFWADDDNPDEHDRRFPDCPAVAAKNDRLCEGHGAKVQVCGECGYNHDGDRVYFRSWPCPTFAAASAVGVGAAQTRTEET